MCKQKAIAENGGFDKIKAAVLCLSEGLIKYTLLPGYGGIKEGCRRVLLCQFK